MYDLNPSYAPHSSSSHYIHFALYLSRFLSPPHGQALTTLTLISETSTMSNHPFYAGAQPTFMLPDYVFPLNIDPNFWSLSSLPPMSVFANPNQPLFPPPPPVIATPRNGYYHPQPSIHCKSESSMSSREAETPSPPAYTQAPEIPRCPPRQMKIPPQKGPKSFPCPHSNCGMVLKKNSTFQVVSLSWTRRNSCSNGLLRH